MGEAIRSAVPVRRPGAAVPRLRPRLRRWLLSVAGALLLLVAAVFLGGGWYLSGVVGRELEAGARLEAWATHEYPLTVTSLSTPPGSAVALVTLRLPAGAGEAAAEGTWGVRAAEGGFGQIGRIVSMSGHQVTREFTQLTGPAIHVGEKLELVNDSFPEDPQAALGIPYENVAFGGPLGTYPAWYIAGTEPDWAILVHGNAMHRQDTLEPMGAIHRAGLPMLVITYRNDPGAPATADRVLRYGANEWEDLQAAVSYALVHGARNVILVGRSMGGGIVLSFLEHSSLAGRVTAAVLDAPMSDFSAAVDYGAANYQLPLGLKIPGPLFATGKWMTTIRYRLDWSAMDYRAADSKLKAPILLFQGGSDRIVPQSMSDRLAADRPDLITYVVTPGAGHLDSWNLDRARYESDLQQFVSRYAAA